MLSVNQVTKSFGTGDEAVSVLKRVSFSVPTGSFTAIVGRSGSGKSTLLTLMGALDQPSSGTITLNEQLLGNLSERNLTRYRGRTIGFVFQQFYLIPNLTALENVMLPLEFANVASRERHLRASALLDEVGISGAKQQRLPRRLSGGEQQRVAIARALANRPRVILADEPTGNLDSENGQRIVDLLYRLTRTTDTTIILVTHDMSIARQCDQILRLADGQLVPA